MISGSATQFEPIWKVPTAFTSLVGREQELARIASLLLRPDVRLLTLVGPGGIGKTRLALQVASVMREHFLDGIGFVTLTAVFDPTLVPQVIAETLNIPEAGSRPLLEQIKLWLSDKQLLLMLDNFEQVIAAAPLVEELLSSCPSLKILITSREVIHLQAEYEYPLAPLALPDLKQLPAGKSLTDYAAIALFVERVQTVLPNFQLTPTSTKAIAEICVRLDGLPLALELAAARVKLFPPSALLVRLSQRFELLTGGARTRPLHQQTLRDTLKWSYDLLTKEEQQLFRRLAIFVGSFTLEAAEAVCYQTREQATLQNITSLLDKSLLRRVEQLDVLEEEPRLHMLMTVREFGLECLERAGELAMLRSAHSTYYLALAEQAEPHLLGGEQVRWLSRLDQEHENIQMTLTWLFESTQAESAAQAERAARLCAALYLFWWQRGHLREGSTFLEQALKTRAGVSVQVQARVLYALAMHVFILQGVERAQTLCEESLALHKEAGDTNGIARCLFLLGRLARNRCQYASAHQFLEEAVALFQGIGNTRQSSLCLSELALVFAAQCQYTRASTLLEASLVQARAAGDGGLMAWSCHQLALILFLSQADLSEVQTRLEESITLYTNMEDHWHIAYGLNLAGEMHLSKDELAPARTLLEQSMKTFREMGSRVDIAEFQVSLARVLQAQGDASGAYTYYRESLMELVELSDKEPVPACLEGLAAVLAGQGSIQKATQLWGGAEALRNNFSMPLPPVYRAGYERDIAAARAQQGEKAFTAAWTVGRTMPLEQLLTMLKHTTIESSPPIEHTPASNKPAAPTTYPDELTIREVEVLRLIAQGWTDAQIAEQLVISPRTVNKHLTTIYRKIAVSTRSAATRYVFAHKLLDAL